ncbi:MAG: phosphopentomutase [Clostridia bacterium]|nr:phosphopentomutase [Clostridia bacterium]
MSKRVFIIVLDSFGVGELPDAERFGDSGSHTLRSVAAQKEFYCPNLQRLGLFNIEGCQVAGYKAAEAPMAAYGRMSELSCGKDTTTGHWEIAGLVSNTPMPTYPEGFPSEVIAEFERLTGRKTLCNKPYSGTQVIADYGEEHLRTGALIVYTSADSVFQIAAHADIVPLEQLYEYCRIARRLLQGEHGVGRVIARPFGGAHPFVRLSGRHDYSLEPHGETMLDRLKAKGFDVISVGKISDIFAGRGITEGYPTKSNAEGMEIATAMQEKNFNGLCFVNLVDFDSSYGHRNDPVGYARAMTEFDAALGEFLSGMREDDLLIVTADHGCDPLTPSTDHSREYVPLLVYGKSIEAEALGTKKGFLYVSELTEQYLG